MLIVACHGTDVADFERFHCLPHFGSGAAAAAILKHPVGNNPRVIVAEIEMRNPVWVPDNECSTQDGSFYSSVIDYLVEIGMLTRDDADEWWVNDDFKPGHGLKENEGWSGIASILLDHGIDGLIYSNTVEDIDSVSIIPIHPAQVNIIEIVPMPERDPPAHLLNIRPDVSPHHDHPRTGATDESPIAPGL